jgi:hypothetical protein
MSEKDKQALREKYKAQRQAMWSGERSAPDKSPQAETVPDDTGNQDKITPSPTTDNRLSQTETGREAFHPQREEARQRGSRVQPDPEAQEQARASNLTQDLNTGGSAPQSQQARPADALHSVTSSDDTPATPDGASLVREKIQEQTEDISENQFSVRSDRRRQPHKISKSDQEFWQTPEEEGEKKVLTWKLAVGVVGTVIVLIGVGIWLGYLFAS